MQGHFHRFAIMGNSAQIVQKTFQSPDTDLGRSSLSPLLNARLVDVCKFLVLSKDCREDFIEYARSGDWIEEWLNSFSENQSAILRLQSQRASVFGDFPFSSGKVNPNISCKGTSSKKKSLLAAGIETASQKIRHLFRDEFMPRTDVQNAAIFPASSGKYPHSTFVHGFQSEQTLHACILTCAMQVFMQSNKFSDYLDIASDEHFPAICLKEKIRAAMLKGSSSDNFSLSSASVAETTRREDSSTDHAPKVLSNTDKETRHSLHCFFQESLQHLQPSSLESMLASDKQLWSQHLSDFLEDPSLSMAIAVLNPSVALELQQKQDQSVQQQDSRTQKILRVSSRSTASLHSYSSHDDHHTKIGRSSSRSTNSISSTASAASMSVKKGNYPFALMSSNFSTATSSPDGKSNSSHNPNMLTLNSLLSRCDEFVQAQLQRFPDEEESLSRYPIGSHRSEKSTWQQYKRSVHSLRAALRDRTYAQAILPKAITSMNADKDISKSDRVLWILKPIFRKGDVSPVAGGTKHRFLHVPGEDADDDRAQRCAFMLLILYDIPSTLSEEYVHMSATATGRNMLMVRSPPVTTPEQVASSTPYEGNSLPSTSEKDTVDEEFDLFRASAPEVSSSENLIQTVESGEILGSSGGQVHAMNPTEKRTSPIAQSVSTENHEAHAAYIQLQHDLGVLDLVMNLIPALIV